jgi:hypothetical protein
VFTGCCVCARCPEIGLVEGPGADLHDHDITEAIREDRLFCIKGGKVDEDIP